MGAGFTLNILLTGGAGYIGSHTAVLLLQSGHDVCVLDNFCNSDKTVLERIARVAGKSLSLVEADVCNTVAVLAALKKYEVQAVIHFAGLKAVGESVVHPIGYYANNVQGAISLVQAMQSAGVKTLVFSSSATVYGSPQYLPIDESHPTSATNPYWRTKVHIEEMLLDVARSDSEWRITCLRYFNPVGAHESGLIGENPRGVPNNLMPFVAQVASGQRARVQVFGSDYPTADGTGVRDYVHVMDLAEGHLAALQYLPKHAGWQSFNLGTGHGISVLQLIHAFEAASGQVVPLELGPRRAGDVAACYANADNARELLGWRAKRDLASMCESTWNFQSKYLPENNGK
jgi:UDP-glucose 4-epimerase